MGRVINIADPGKRRNHERRTIAEMLRRLMLKRTLDQEAKDMAATLVFCLREIASTVDVSVAAWEKRNYYVKADRFCREWEWVLPTAQRLQDLILQERWEQLPQGLAQLAPHFADIRITKMTRAPSAWGSGHARLLERSRAANTRQ
jgi:hypothetical protein